MDIDRRLLGRAFALLSEAHELVGRAYAKAADYPGEDADQDQLDKLSTLITQIESLISMADNLAKED